MIKNITIAVLIGIVIGQICRADSPSTGVITKKDLFAAAALCGILANENSNPLGYKLLFNDIRNELRSKDKFVAGANYYADKLIQDSLAVQ